MFKVNIKLLLMMVLCMVMLLSFSACQSIGLGKESEIVAKVNGYAISKKEFDDEFQVLKSMYQKQLGDDILSQETDDNRNYESVFKDNLLEAMILEKLIAEEMEKLRIRVTDEEIEKLIKDQYIDGLGGKKKYKDFLEANNFTEEFLESSLRKKIMGDKYREYFFDKVNIVQTEIQEYYNSHKENLKKVRTSLIQIKTKEDGNKILKRLDDGENFHELAIAESIDPITAAKEGDMGYFPRDTAKYPTELVEAAFKLKDGQISDLIKSESGYYIILLEDKKEKYEDLEEDIVVILKNEAYINKLSQLRDNADIRIYEF